MPKTRKSGRPMVSYVDGTYWIEDMGEFTSPRFYLVKSPNTVVDKNDDPLELEFKHMNEIYGKDGANAIRKYQSEEKESRRRT